MSSPAVSHSDTFATSQIWDPQSKEHYSAEFRNEQFGQGVRDDQIDPHLSSCHFTIGRVPHELNARRIFVQQHNGFTNPFNFFGFPSQKRIVQESSKSILFAELTKDTNSKLTLTFKRLIEHDRPTT